MDSIEITRDIGDLANLNNLQRRQRWRLDKKKGRLLFKGNNRLCREYKRHREDARWLTKVCKDFGLESTIRRRGRPTKETDA